MDQDPEAVRQGVDGDGDVNDLGGKPGQASEQQQRAGESPW
jgi:hypothetical protein